MNTPSLANVKQLQAFNAYAWQVLRSFDVERHEPTPLPAAMAYMLSELERSNFVRELLPVTTAVTGAGEAVKRALRRLEGPSPETLLEARKAAKLSQRTVAEATGRSASYIHYAETGQRTPPAGTRWFILETIAKLSASNQLAVSSENHTVQTDGAGA